MAAASYLNEYPFESHFVELDGHRYHYIDEGQGPVVLMVHGNPTWSFAWRHLVRGLCEDHRVIAIDHIGCGLSDKPSTYEYSLRKHTDNLVRCITQLDLENITLFAHDWGGAIGMGAANKLPARFDRFVLFNTAAFRSSYIPLRIAVCRIPILGAVAIRGLNLFSRAALRMAVEKRDRMTAAVRAGFLAPYHSWRTRIAVQRFVGDIPLSPQHPSYAALLETELGLEQFRQHPVMFVWGERDWCFTLRFLREFQRRFPWATTFSIPDAGHYVFEDAHERIVPRVRAFLERGV